ncbi:MAG: N-acetylgalactosamine-6-sulfatase [Bacteroidetes bacterium]|nr:MAG: N-acetylgalactosamine-6-sulfatase [Bacteroidota bacterium]
MRIFQTVLLKIASVFFITILLNSSCSTIEKNDSNSKLPNIIYILADDLGYNELGCYGQNIIETPNIDKLSENGIRFTQHYSGSPVCAPSRDVLLTGLHAGHAYIRGNDAVATRGDVWDFEKASSNPYLEGQRPIPDSSITIAELLKQKNYTTACIGKWGLGGPLTEGNPNKQGFDFFYGYNCQRQAHTYYPLHLWKNGLKDTLRNKLLKPHTPLAENLDPNNPESYIQYTDKDYSPDLMMKEALGFIENQKNKPFYLYYASPIPHVALQAPEKWIKKYHDKFGEEKPYTGNKGYYPSRYPRATYAAMISYLDDQVGQIVSKLKELGIYENTLIIFSSDNGPTYTGGVDFEFFESSKPFHNGYGWTKGYLHEGGIRVPMIASWPGHISKGTVSTHISAFYDVLPTICEITEIEKPQNTDGISFLPELLGKDNVKHEYLYWEFAGYNGQQAVRMGKWKAIRKNIEKGNLEIELYNLEKDLLEKNNVANENPLVIEKMEEIMRKEHTPSKHFKLTSLDSLMI